MTKEQFLASFEFLAEAPNGVQELRKLILQLAVRGTLVPQNPQDEPASVFLQRLAAKRRDDSVESGRRSCRATNGSNAHRPPYNLPSTWTWATFREVASIESNLVAPQGYLGSPHIAPNNIEKATGRLLDYRTVGEDGVSSGNHRFFAGQILYSKIRPNLSKATIVDFDGLCSADMYPITAHVHAPYLLVYILSGTFLKMAVRNDTRVAMPKINQQELNAIVVAVPPEQEQKRIAAKVDELMGLCDKLEARQMKQAECRIQMNTAAISCLSAARSADEFATHWQRIRDHFDLLYDDPGNISALRDTILRSAVEGKLVRQQQGENAVQLIERIQSVRQTRVNGARRNRNDDLPPVGDKDAPFASSAGWSWQRFGWLAEIVGGVTLGRKLDSRRTVSYPYLRVANVQSGSLDLSVIKEVEIHADELEKYQLAVGDVLLTEGGDWDKLGRSAIWAGQIPVCLHQNHIFRARMHDPGLRPAWVSMFTNSPVGREYFQSASKQTTNLASINMTQLRHCPIPVPSTAEQDRILNRVAELMSLCDQLESALERGRSIAARLADALVRCILVDETAVPAVA